MEEFVRDVILVLVIVVILLVIVDIFLNYKWKLDIQSSITISFSHLSQRHRDDNNRDLRSLSDEVRRFTRDWDNGINRVDPTDHSDSQDDDRDRIAMDDFFDRYIK